MKTTRINSCECQQAKRLAIVKMVILSFILMSSCTPNKNSPYNKEYLNVEQKARIAIQPMLRIGESTTNIISQFGSPIDTCELNSGELRLDFVFSSRNTKLFQANGVHGFVAWFTNNQLVRWDPIFSAP